MSIGEDLISDGAMPVLLTIRGKVATLTLRDGSMVDVTVIPFQERSQEQDADGNLSTVRRHRIVVDPSEVSNPDAVESVTIDGVEWNVEPGPLMQNSARMVFAIERVESTERSHPHYGGR